MTDKAPILPVVVPHDLTRLAKQVGPWQDERWPQHGNPISKALKVAEEAGEVAGAVIKQAEGRKTLHHIADEIGDVVIALAGLCETLDIPFGVVVGERWFEVRGRHSDSSDRDVSGRRRWNADDRQ